MIYDPKTFLKSLDKNSEIYMSYESDEKLTWCSGCGNYNIQNALKMALAQEGLTKQDVIFCFDVGCNGNGSDKIDGYTFHGLHGRVLPLAGGVAIANPHTKTIAIAGDGATLSEGINHFIHAIRNNYKILFMLHNNSLYGLTTGQPSATTRKGYKMNSAPDGVYLDPINVSELALSLGPTFVARSFSGDVGHLNEMIRAGLNHNGFALLEIFQVCTTYNKATTQDWYWEHIQYTHEIKNYDPHSLDKAKKLAQDLDQKITMGILYEDKESRDFMELLPNRQEIKTAPRDEVKHYKIDKLLKPFY